MSTHALTVTFDGSLDEVTVGVLCQNDPSDPHRDCKYSDGPSADDCPNVAYAAPEEMAYRAIHGYRYSCGGWQWDGEHLHPSDGCGVQWSIDQCGIEVLGIEGHMVASSVATVTWEEGCPVLMPQAVDA